MSTPQRIGISGHQTLSRATQQAVSDAIKSELVNRGALVGISSLAVGADQIFARAVLETGHPLRVIIPSKTYGKTFETPEDLAEYHRLLAAAEHVETLPFDTSTEEAFFAAGKAIVGQSDLLFAVWDGKPAAGLGGTADVVQYAKDLGRDVIIIWPSGASRK